MNATPAERRVGAGNPLQRLGAAELTRLGGLKPRCSASLKCVMHGCLLPCDACVVEGPSGAVCTACDHLFPQGSPGEGDRACDSVEQFGITGRIAFEEDARDAFSKEEGLRKCDEERALALAELKRQEEDARSRDAKKIEREKARKRDKELADRERDAAERAERELAEREESERAELARKAAEAAAAAAERSRIEADNAGRRPSMSLAISFVATVFGATMAWELPLIPRPATSFGYLLVYVCTVLLAWRMGMAALFGKKPAHATLRWWGPLPWAAVGFAWPALIGLAACQILAADGLSTLGRAAMGLGVFWAGLKAMLYVGACLSMAPPWPEPSIKRDSRGLRSGWVRLGLIATLVLNAALFTGHGWEPPHEETAAKLATPQDTSAVPVVPGNQTKPEDAANAPAIEAAASASAPVIDLPPMDGYVTDVGNALSWDDKRYLAERMELLGELGARVRIVTVPNTGSETIQQYSKRIGTAWNSSGEESRSDLVIVVSKENKQIGFEMATLNRTLPDEASSKLIGDYLARSARNDAIGTGLRKLSDQLEPILAAPKYASMTPDGLRDATGLLVTRVVSSMADLWHPVRSPGEDARRDSAIARLGAMPKPARGDRKKARRLYDAGMSLIGQPGFESLVVDKLQEANSTDPLDVQILNDLAYAEMLASQPASAVEHLLQTLRLSPTRSSAWFNLSEALLATGRSVGDTPAACYVAGYWFSRNRTKSVTYLTNKSNAQDTSEENRLAATKALQVIARIEQ